MICCAVYYYSIKIPFISYSPNSRSSRFRGRVLWLRGRARRAPRGMSKIIELDVSLLPVCCTCSFVSAAARELSVVVGRELPPESDEVRKRRSERVRERKGKKKKKEWEHVPPRTFLKENARVAKRAHGIPKVCHFVGGEKYHRQREAECRSRRHVLH